MSKKMYTMRVKMYTMTIKMYTMCRTMCKRSVKVNGWQMSACYSIDCTQWVKIESMSGFHVYNEYTNVYNECIKERLIVASLLLNWLCTMSIKMYAMRTQMNACDAYTNDALSMQVNDWQMSACYSMNCVQWVYNCIQCGLKWIRCGLKWIRCVYKCIQWVYKWIIGKCRLATRLTV